jgi:hypothetical protein
MEAFALLVLVVLLAVTYGVYRIAVVTKGTQR